MPCDVKLQQLQQRDAEEFAPSPTEFSVQIGNADELDLRAGLDASAAIYSEDRLLCAHVDTSPMLCFR